MTKSLQTPLVSIVINNYNYEDFISASIESALVQSYPHIEVIVVDDGSTDASWDKISAYKDRKNVRIIAQSNGGQGSAINRGFKEALGQWVLFLDADDYLKSDAIETILEKDLNGVSKIQFQLAVVNSQGAECGFRLPNRKMGIVSPKKMVASSGYYISPPSSGNMYSHSFLQKLLPMDEKRWRISADAYLLLAAPFYGRILSIETILGCYRRHGKGASDLDTKNLDALRGYVMKEKRKEENRRSWVEELCRQFYSGDEWKGFKGLSPTLVKYRVLSDISNNIKYGERVQAAIYVSTSSLFWYDYTLWQKLRLVIWAFVCYSLTVKMAIRVAGKTLHPHLRSSR